METGRHAADYSSRVTETSFSHLLELTAALAEYRGYLVLVGGWVPYLLLKSFKRPTVDFTHIGSIDIDLAVNPSLFSEGLDKYRTVIEHIARLGYTEKRDRLKNVVPASFVKETKEGISVQVDFLTSYEVEIGRSKRHLKVQQDLFARRTKGCDIAFEHNWECELVGKLPGDGTIQLRTTTADIVSAVVMKGHALDGRLEGKDPYDIYSMITYYKEGPKAVAEEFSGCLEETLVSDSLSIIKKHFSTRQSDGPARAGYFLYPNDVVMREKAVTDAYMNLREFFALL